MIVRFRKQLIQWIFLEHRHAHNLKKSIERKLQGQSLFDDRNECVNRDGHPDLRPDGALRRPVKRLNPQVLFDPTEEQFDLTTELIELGDHQRRQFRATSRIVAEYPELQFW
jgi:hypothetical protein